MLSLRLLSSTCLIAGLLVLLGVDQLIGAPQIGPLELPPGPLIALAAAGFAGIGGRELARFLGGGEVPRGTVRLALAAGASVLIVYIAQAWPIGALGLVTIVFLAAATGPHVRMRRPGGALATAGGTALAMGYVGGLLGIFVLIRAESSAWVMAGLILIVKSADIGAYATGRLLGRHPLIPWLSPKKTVEGLVGGLALAALAGAGGAAIAPPDGPASAGPLRGALAGVGLGAAGQIGDLVISLWKRDAGAKDAGQSIPGFGGVLDVADAPLVAAPLAYALMAY